jgi:cytidyltransferase-like protein
VKKKVFVSGCYDLPHSGHVEFFRRAARYGDLYVSIGSDKTIKELKSREAFFPEQERLFLVKSIKYVKNAYIAKGGGMMDFMDVFNRVKPDIFVVNKDGDRPEKRQLCRNLGIRYIVLKRTPKRGLTARSSTELRKVVNPVSDNQVSPKNLGEQEQKSQNDKRQEE